MAATGLSISGEREHGQDVRSANVTAVLAVANTLRTSLGPQGLDKMLVDQIGEVTISNDGATILAQLDVEHPAAKVLASFRTCRIRRSVMARPRSFSSQQSSSPEAMTS
jgi:hypothetical protein